MRGPALTPDDDERIGYDERGLCIDFDSPACVAKTAIHPKSEKSRYWIRRAMTGANPGSLFNAHARYYQFAATPANHDAYLWCPVVGACFDSYLRFLATGNIEHYKKAERLACQRTS